MKDSKTKNSVRNLFTGVVLKIYQILLPFVLRTMLIRILGMEYAGLNSLFTSILSMLNIAELGVGTALVISMYKPIEENDQAKICALMKIYRLYYRIIGLVILIIGGVLTPFLPYLISGEVPADVNLYILYALNLGATVLSYWLFAYRNSLFTAHQRLDVVNVITLVTDTIKYGLQIVLLMTTKNYYAYLAVALFSQVLTNIITAIASRIYYPNYSPKGDLSVEEKKVLNKSIKDLAYSQFGYIITLSFDSIVISAFLGLVPLAIYNNYYYILNALMAFFTIFSHSLSASVGTNMLVKDSASNFKDFKYITFVVFGLLTFCCSCLATMYQPFIELWVGKENLLDIWCVILFAIYLVVYEMVFLMELYKSSTGKWHSDRFRPFITAIINLTLNLTLVNFIGIYGILLSTIVSFAFFNLPWLIHRTFIDAFPKEYEKNYLSYLGLKILSLVGIVTISFFACYYLPIINLWAKLFINFGISAFLSIILYFIVSFKDSGVRRTFQLVRSFLRKDTAK